MCSILPQKKTAWAFLGTLKDAALVFCYEALRDVIVSFTFSGLWQHIYHFFALNDAHCKRGTSNCLVSCSRCMLRAFLVVVVFFNKATGKNSRCVSDYLNFG